MLKDIINIDNVKQNIRKNIIIVAVVSVLLVIMVPLLLYIEKPIIEEGATYLKQLQITLEANVDTSQTYKQIATDELIFNAYTLVVILGLPVILAVRLFSNKQNLETNKKETYFTKIVSAATLIKIPFIIVSVCLIILKLLLGMNDYIMWTSIVSYALYGIIFAMIVFLISILIGFITQNRIKNVIYTYIFMYIPLMIIYIAETLLARIIYGFPGYSDSFNNILELFPIVKMFNVFVGTQMVNMFGSVSEILTTVGYVVILIIVMLLLYKLFKTISEKMYKIADKILKYTGLLIISSIIYLYNWIIFANPVIAIIMTMSIILIANIFIQMIKQRKLNIFKSIKRYYIISGTTILTVLILSNIFIGYENTVPNIEDIEYMTYTSIYPENEDNIQYRTPENIEYLIDIHKNAIINKNEPFDITSEEYETIFVNYQLKNGEQIVRSYELKIENEGIFETEEYIKQKYSLIFDQSQFIDIFQILGIYNDQTFQIKLTAYEQEELLNSIIEAIKVDLIDNKVYITEEYSVNEELKLVKIDFAIGIDQYVDYLYYLKIDENYELMEIIEKLIDEQSDLIVWGASE